MFPMGLPGLVVGRQPNHKAKQKKAKKKSRKLALGQKAAAVPPLGHFRWYCSIAYIRATGATRAAHRIYRARAFFFGTVSRRVWVKGRGFGR